MSQEVARPLVELEAKAIEKFDGIFMFDGIAYDEPGDDSLLKIFLDIPEASRQPIADVLINRHLSDVTPSINEIILRVNEDDKITDEMLRNRGTMRAAFIASLQSPSKEVFN